MGSSETHVCPVEYSGSLDHRFRRLLHKPEKILQPFIKKGITALDLGCGPGYFTIPMAHLTGITGKVIAADLQQGMLDKVGAKIKGTNLEQIITLHKCGSEKIKITEPVDFILLFYMVHEISDKTRFFNEIKTIIKPTGSILIVEPPIHVSKADFSKTLETAEIAGFTASTGPQMPLNKTAILKPN